MVKILKRCLLLGKKVLYKSPIHIAPLSSTLHAVNGQFLFLAKLLKWLYLGDGTQKNKNKKMLRKFTYIDTFMPIYEPKFPIPIA